MAAGATGGDWRAELPFLAALCDGLEVGVLVLAGRNAPEIAFVSEPCAALLGVPRSALEHLSLGDFVAALRAAVDVEPEALRTGSLWASASAPTVCEELEVKRPARAVLRWQARWVEEPTPLQIITLTNLTVEIDLGVAYQRLALTDALTGLPNRRQADETLRRELARARRYETALAIALVDIDDLQAINEVVGHDRGDAALVAVASAIARSIRESDFAARWGDEEFLIVMPNTDLPGALIPCERVRAGVALTSEIGTSLTVSIGVALHAAGESVETILKRADTLLRRAKYDGKNCVRG